MSRSFRYKVRNSDRSGFKYKQRELVKDGPSWVHPDEIDAPPPSKISLGGEGDISGDPRPNSTFYSAGTGNILPVYDHPTFFITAVGGITPDFNHAYMRIEGSNGNITVSANPSIKIGIQSQVLSLFCTGSSITLNHGNGLNMMGSTGFTMQSGGVLTLIYNSGNTAWNETSRSSNGFGG